MRFAILLLCIVALVVLVGTLRADSNAENRTVGVEEDTTALIVGETFPEPISTVFILAGAAAMGLWK
ncbi:MAG: hypothetical protein GWP05_11280, partial [Anaerolineaceae bacterium]|nr:hypothetical protein [Anaerolineaceae bacterium]